MQDDNGDQGRQRWTGRLRRVLGVLLLMLAGGLSGLPSLWLQELGRIGRAFPEEASRVGQAVQANEPLALAGEAARTAAISALGVVAEAEVEPPALATDDGAVASEVELNDAAADQVQALADDPAPALPAPSELAAGPSQEQAEPTDATIATVEVSTDVAAGASAESTVADGGSPVGVAPGEAVLAQDSPPSSPDEDKAAEAAMLPGPRHQVAPGETLSGIAEEYRVDLAVVLEANALDPSVPIMIGQDLVVPGGARAVLTAAPAKPLVARAVATAIPAARPPAAPAVAQRPVAPTPKPVAPTPKPVPPKPPTAAAPTPARELAARIVPASALPAVLPGRSADTSSRRRCQSGVHPGAAQRTGPGRRIWHVGPRGGARPGGGRGEAQLRLRLAHHAGPRERADHALRSPIPTRRCPGRQGYAGSGDRRRQRDRPGQRATSALRGGSRRRHGRSTALPAVTAGSLPLAQAA